MTAVELGKLLVWKQRHGGAMEGLFNCFFNSGIPEEEAALGWHLYCLVTEVGSCRGDPTLTWCQARGGQRV